MNDFLPIVVVCPEMARARLQRLLPPGVLCGENLGSGPISFCPWEIPYGKLAPLNDKTAKSEKEIFAFFGMKPDGEPDAQKALLSNLLLKSVVVHLIFLDNEPWVASEDWNVPRTSFKELMQWGNGLKAVQEGGYLPQDSFSKHILVTISTRPQVNVTQWELDGLENCIGESSPQKRKPFHAGYFMDYSLNLGEASSEAKVCWDRMVERLLLAMVLSQSSEATPIWSKPGLKVWRACDCIFAEDKTLHSFLKKEVGNVLEWWNPKMEASGFSCQNDNKDAGKLSNDAISYWQELGAIDARRNAAQQLVLTSSQELQQIQKSKRKTVMAILIVFLLACIASFFMWQYHIVIFSMADLMLALLILAHFQTVRRASKKLQMASLDLNSLTAAYDTLVSQVAACGTAWQQTLAAQNAQEKTRRLKQRFNAIVETELFAALENDIPLAERDAFLKATQMTLGPLAIEHANLNAEMERYFKDEAPGSFRTLLATPGYIPSCLVASRIRQFVRRFLETLRCKLIKDNISAPGSAIQAQYADRLAKMHNMDAGSFWSAEASHALTEKTTAMFVHPLLCDENKENETIASDLLINTPIAALYYQEYPVTFVLKTTSGTTAINGQLTLEGKKIIQQL